MTKDVLVTVSGNMAGPEEKDSVEVTTQGVYYYKNGNHHIFYEEIGDDASTVVKNRITISDYHVDVRKKGAVDVIMSFQEGKKLNSFYNTMFGQMELGIITDRIELQETEKRLELTLHYQLEVNNEYVSENDLHLVIEDR